MRTVAQLTVLVWETKAVVDRPKLDGFCWTKSSHKSLVSSSENQELERKQNTAEKKCYQQLLPKRPRLEATLGGL